MTHAISLHLRHLLWVPFILFYFACEALTCKIGFTVNLDQDGLIVLNASDVVLNTNTCCNNEEAIEILDYNSLDYLPSITFNCNYIGQNPLQIRVTDCFGNKSFCETYVIIQDQIGICGQGCDSCCLPDLRVRSLVTALSENGTVTLSADWFDDGSVSQCTGGDLQFSFSQNANDAFTSISCDEIGYFPLQVWATDAAGNQAMAETYAIIQDNFTDCAGNLGCRPVPIILNGVVLSLLPGGTACISADAFDGGSQPNPCNGGTSYSLAFSNDPSNTIACFDCYDMGQQPIEVYIFDNLGNFNKIDTYITIQYYTDIYCWDDSFAPVNDVVCSAVPIDYLFNAVCSTSRFHNINATVSPNEISPPLDACNVPNTWCDVGGPESTVWFKFEAPAAHTVYISATGINTQLALWEAADCEAILSGNATMVVANDDVPSLAGGGSLITAECLEAGKTYYLQVDGHDHQEEFFDLTVSYEGTACTNLSQETLEKWGDFTITPNPASRAVGIYFDIWGNHNGGNLIISDMSGKTVMTIPFEATAQKLVFSMEQLNTGIYFARIQTNGMKSLSKKLAIVH